MTLLADVRRLQDAMKEVRDMAEGNREMLRKHEEQISGERGLSQAINACAAEIRSLRKAAYWIAGLIVASSIGFAFSVLTVFSP